MFYVTRSRYCRRLLEHEGHIATPHLLPTMQAEKDAASRSTAQNLTNCASVRITHLLEVFALKSRVDFAAVTLLKVVRIRDRSCEEAAPERAVSNDADAELAACWDQILL